jgi:membrane protein implicated in regulation of membrane protease activity
MPEQTARSGPSRRTVRRYALLQIPDLVMLGLVLLLLHQLVGLSRPLLLLVVLAWLIKDVALFPLVWRAYADDVQGFSFSPVGRRGVVVERLAPTGMVRVRGELWRATGQVGSAPTEVGAAVRVREARGLSLVVEPWPGDAPPG